MNTVNSQLQGTRYFTKLDLRCAYNLVRIRKGDEWKTAFSMTYLHYKYQLMSYGLANTSSVFQAFMNDMLRDMLGKYLVNYIDDILVFHLLLLYMCPMSVRGASEAGESPAVCEGGEVSVSLDINLRFRLPDWHEGSEDGG